ncbi:MAG: CheR family methyltransferase [Pseudomonadota bacterium]
MDNLPPTQMPIQVECEEALIKLVRELTGIRILDHQLGRFRHTITQACYQFNCNSSEEYLQVLQHSSLNSAMQEHLIAGITIGESYFFRDRSQMDFLSSSILPKLIRQRRDQGSLFLRIWSAGCSDGQELYSVLMLLMQLLPDIENWKLHLLGTDINVEALSRAITGTYAEWSLRSTKTTLREQFFDRTGQQWILKRSLQRLTKFSYLNLYGDKFPSILSETNAMDLILCRNVFIYFDPLTAKAVMEKFYQSLLPGGYLLQGASDLLDSSHSSGFEQHIIADTSYYLRPDRAFEADESLTSQNTTVADINLTATFTEPDSKKKLLQPNLSTTNNISTTDAIISQSTPIPIAIKVYKTIIQNLTAEAWDMALISINKRLLAGDNNALIWQFKAKALANLGQIIAALKSCSLSLEHNPEDKHTYFIQALVYMEARRFDKAERALKQTLYLDRQFVEAHYHLGLLHLLQGKRESGLKYMHNALEISENADPLRSLHDAAGMNHERMTTILRSELKMYQGMS